MKYSPVLRGIFFISIFLFCIDAFALGMNLEIGVSPPRHEFTIGTGKTITREVKVFNNSSVDTYNIQLSSGDCVADSQDGTPICHNYSGTGSDSKSLSSWISFENNGRFSIGPKKEKVVKITFNAPANALPGGHYGIVYFTPDVGATNNTVTMVRQLGVIFQVNVPGKLIYDIGLGEIEIDTPFFSAPDPFQDFMKSPGKKETWSGALDYIKTELNPFWNKPELVNSSDFNVKFSIPISNSGNVDIRPIGRIELYDEGRLLKKIGKESIRSQEGLFLGEKIVDYLPINDEGGSVLPDGERKRIYTVNWKGFAYETYEDGKMVVKFQTPGEYYSNITANNAAVLYPWEKLSIRIAEKHVKAKIAIEYTGENGKTVPMELERDIVVQYNYIDKVLNTGVILLVVLIVFIAWLLLRKRDRRIDELEEENDELEDEIDELEHARISAKKIIEKKKTVPAKRKDTPEITSSNKKTPVKVKKEVPQTETKIPTNPIKKNTVKKAGNPDMKTEVKSKAPRKPRAKKEVPTTPEV